MPRARPFYGWVVVAVLSVTETITWGIVCYGYPVFLGPMEEALGASRVAITGAFSLGLAVSALSAVPVGRWLDRHGPRGLMTLGSCLGTGLCLAGARVESLPALHAVWIGMGFVLALGSYERVFWLLSVALALVSVAVFPTRTEVTAAAETRAHPAPAGQERGRSEPAPVSCGIARGRKLARGMLVGESATMTAASVVITNHDYGRFVGQAIESALAQTYRGTRVVVVDDGSTDDSSRIIRGYGARVCAVFQGHLGQADAMLAGLRASAGEVVLFLDSDDVLYPGALSEICSRFHAGVAKVQVRLDLIDVHGRPLGRQTPPMAMPSGDLAPLVLRHGWYPAPPTSGNAFSRRVLETLLPVPDSYAGLGAADGKLAVSDHYLSVLGALHGEVVSVSQPLGAYRLHGVSPGGPALLAEIRRRIERAAALSALVPRHAGTRPVASRIQLGLGTPNRVKERLLSLRLDPRGHAPPSDTRWGLVRAGLAAAWTVPWSPRRMRVVQSLGLLVLAGMPTAAIARILAKCVVDHERPRWLSRLVGMEV